MGWYIEHGDRARLIQARVATTCSHTGTRRFETIRHALRGNVLWSVVRISDTMSGEVLGTIIACDLLQRFGPEQWGYKPMDESMHPYYYSCPLSYLDLAEERCPEWRKGVRQYHQHRQARRRQRHLITN